MSNNDSSQIRLKIENQKLLLILLVSGLIAACSSGPSLVELPLLEGESTSQRIDELLANANNSLGVDAAGLRITAIELLLEQGFFERAALESQAQSLSDAMAPELRSRFAMAQARIANSQGDPQSALQFLTETLAPSSGDMNTQFEKLLGDTYLLLDRPADAFRSYLASSKKESSEIKSTETLASEESVQDLHDLVWNALTIIDDAELSSIANSASNYKSRGWIELAKAVADQELSIKGQLDSIQQWRRVWSSHDAARILPRPLVKLQRNWEQRPRQVALLLPLQEQAGRAIQEGFLSAYYQSIEANHGAPIIKFYDSSGVTNIYPLYDEALNDGADLVIGPLDKELVNQLHRLPNLAVPTLALNYTDDNSFSGAGNFFQFGLAPENEIEQAAQLATSAGFKNAAVITPSGSDYLRLNSLFENAWTATGGNIVSRSTFDSESDYAEIIKQSMAIDASEARAAKIEALLPRDRIEFIPRRRQDIDFIYLIANPRQGRQIQPTLAFYFAESLPVIAYPSIYDGSDNTDINRDLNGIIFLDAPWLLQQSNPFKEFVSNSFRKTAGPLERLRAMGIDSYRLHDRLAQFSSSEINSLGGTTGLLTMNSDREIQRQLLAARFIDGAPQLVSPLIPLSR
ncbi:MAG: outer membrane PBP1 activator LpoA protein [Pseudohongiellaceae bacterium]